MNNNQEYISDEDLDYLDDFLLYRINQDEIDYDVDKDEGILCLSELDGFLAAVVSGPVVIPPSKWLPAIWGDFEPEFVSDEEAQKVYDQIKQQSQEKNATANFPEFEKIKNRIKSQMLEKQIISKLMKDVKIKVE